MKGKSHRGPIAERKGAKNVISSSEKKRDIPFRPKTTARGGKGGDRYFWRERAEKWPEPRPMKRTFGGQLGDEIENTKGGAGRDSYRWRGRGRGEEALSTSEGPIEGFAKKNTHRKGGFSTEASGRRSQNPTTSQGKSTFPITAVPHLRKREPRTTHFIGK